MIINETYETYDHELWSMGLPSDIDKCSFRRIFDISKPSLNEFNIEKNKSQLTQPLNEVFKSFLEKNYCEDNNPVNLLDSQLVLFFKEISELFLLNNFNRGFDHGKR